MFGERHLRHVLSCYIDYYNAARTHLSLDKDTPIRRAAPFNQQDASKRSLFSAACTTNTRGFDLREGQRLIGTIRREFLDHLLIWNALDLERKLEEFRIYYNENRVHQSLNGSTPGEESGKPPPIHAVLDHYAWRHHCHRLFQMPIAA